MGWATEMTIIRRVFVSSPPDKALNVQQIAFKWAIVQAISDAGFFPELFCNPRTAEGLAASKPWTGDGLDEVFRHCVGVAIIGLPRWTIPCPSGVVLMPSESSHYEGCLARTRGLPLLLLVQENAVKRGIFDDGFGTYIEKFPAKADPDWIKSVPFAMALHKWKSQIDDRRDIFMGYCSGSADLAQKVKVFIGTATGASILDWKTDFDVGSSVLDQISHAVMRCNSGIFLFTKDDKLSNGAEKRGFFKHPRVEHALSLAIPRDNVVFETGCFMSLKGARRVLVVREAGAKLPADLVGQIYTNLPDRADISPIKDELVRFVSQI